MCIYITNIKYIEGDQLFESYGNTMMVETGIPNFSNKTEFVRKKITCRLTKNDLVIKSKKFS